ncbi:MAG: hypothetical protein ACNA8W_15720, partial [Bradymonadaceae bacterium]
CRELCQAMGRCYELPGGMTLRECQVGCEVSRYDGSVMDRDIRCIGRTMNCAEVSVCVGDFWGCDAPCDASLSCGVHKEPEQCRAWCGVQVVSGMATVGQLGCMETQEREGRCSEMGDICSLEGLPGS